MKLAGYAAIFDAPDRGGDVIRKGAFADAKPGIPLFWQHDPKRRIGTVDQLSEDERGLRVIASLHTRQELPEAVRAHLRPGQGLSFGYRVRGANQGTNRELTDLDLLEVSLVTHPMQPLARVLAVSGEG
jgi:HK97 family phage prohead protease